MSSLLQRWLTKRQVIVHAHMFKNAGTTLDWSLQRSFGDLHLDHRDDDKMREGASYLGPYLSQNTRINAVSSHWITFPLPSLHRTRLDLVLLFRDPIERIRSVYNFERQQQPAETPGAKKAKECSFKDYVSWQLQPMPGPVVKNFQTRYCSGEYLGDDLELLDRKARNTVASTPLIGLVERYEESMVLFEHLLKPDYPQLDLAYQVQNRSDSAQLDAAQRREQVLQELGDIADQVIAANQYDIDLYASVCQRFEEAIAQVPDLDSRVSELRQRNRALH